MRLNMIMHSIVVFMGCLRVLSADFVAYTSNSFGGDVSQINLNPTTGAPTFASISPQTGTTPDQIAIAPNGQNIYITTAGESVAQYRINPMTGAAIFVTATGSPIGIEGIAIAPNGLNAYVTLPTDNQIQQIGLNPSNGNPTVVGSPISSGGTAPLAIVITPDGSNAYVAHEDGSVSQISLDPVTGAPTFVTNVLYMMGVQFRHIAISPDGSHAYVVDQVNDTIVPISFDMTGAPVFGTPFGLAGINPLDVTISPDGNNAYVLEVDPMSFQSLVTQVELTAGLPTMLGGSTLLTGVSGLQAIALAIAPDGKNLYVIDDLGNLAQISIDMSGAPTFVAPLVNTNGLSFDIAITTFTPSPAGNGVQGMQKRNRFLTQTDLYNVITWQGLSTAIFYNIFRDAAHTDLAGSASANGLEMKFKDHNRKKGVTYTYYIVAYDTTLVPMDIGSVTVPPGN